MFLIQSSPKLNSKCSSRAALQAQYATQMISFFWLLNAANSQLPITLPSSLLNIISFPSTEGRTGIAWKPPEE
jgi:hypothetical protein